MGRNSTTNGEPGHAGSFRGLPGAGFRGPQVLAHAGSPRTDTSTDWRGLPVLERRLGRQKGQE